MLNNIKCHYFVPTIRSRNERIWLRGGSFTWSNFKISISAIPRTPPLSWLLVDVLQSMKRWTLTRQDKALEFRHEQAWERQARICSIWLCYVVLDKIQFRSGCRFLCSRKHANTARKECGRTEVDTPACSWDKQGKKGRLASELYDNVHQYLLMNESCDTFLRWSIMTKSAFIFLQYFQLFFKSIKDIRSKNLSITGGKEDKWELV